MAELGTNKHSIKDELSNKTQFAKKIGKKENIKAMAESFELNFAISEIDVKSGKDRVDVFAQTEGRSTGFPKIYEAMKQNGSPEPTFETDDNRTYFLATLPIHSSLKVRGQDEGQGEGQAAKEELNTTEHAILKTLLQGPSSRSDLLNALGMKKRTGYFRRLIDRLMDSGFISYTYPDTPRHPDQKYEITELGKQQIGKTKDAQ